MSKNILAISTSPRKGENSETLADAVGAIQGNPALKEAYEMGTKVCICRSADSLPCFFYWCL